MSTGKDQTPVDADHAALLQAVNDVLNYVHCHSVDMGGNHRYSFMLGHGRAVALLQHLAAQPHPSAALLEDHRKALVRARNEGLERAANAARALMEGQSGGVLKSLQMVARDIDAMKESET